LPESLILSLCNGEIESQQYLHDVVLLNDKLSRSRQAEIAESKALEEVKPELEKLMFKVCSRARNFLISKINNL
jgi:hypothetical protein